MFLLLKIESIFMDRYIIKYFLKVFFLSTAVLFTSVNADILYKSEDLLDHEYEHINMQYLADSAQHDDNKKTYLLALHKIHNPKEKYEGASILKNLANSNITDAKHSLYTISKWAKIDGLTPQSTFGYLKEASEEGLARAQVDLAIAYLEGTVGEKNISLYHYWMSKAAEQNDYAAMINTAGDYYAARGVAKDEQKGFEWVIKAYKSSGREFSHWGLLGQIYEQGRGTPQNLVKAYMCYDLNGTAGIENKERVALKMTPAQQAEGLRLSEQWQTENHVYTMQSLGLKRQRDGSYR